jgi:CheY-like chemotaxis protein
MSPISYLLLVDDDQDDQQIFAEALENVAPEIQIITASNGLEAMHKLNTPKAKQPDIIFLDLNMPMMNGKEFLEELKKTKSFSHIPVVIYTTSSRREDEEDTLALGAAHFLVKPHDYSELCRQIKQVLERP